MSGSSSFPNQAVRVTVAAGAMATRSPYGWTYPTSQFGATGTRKWAAGARQSRLVLWSYPIGATVYGGPAVVDGVVYWGNGYQTVAGTRGKGLFAFHVP